jgi:hypothetical protein
MINREQLKLAIDLIDDTHLEILHRILLAFRNPHSTSAKFSGETNPLKGSITFESDIISPIDMSWEVEQ